MEMLKINVRKKMANYVPNKIRIDGKWYRTAEEATGSLNFKDDLNYHGSTTQIEYTAQKPNPVLHPSLYHVFDKSGSKIGEFRSDPQISCSGRISEIDIDIGISDNSSDYVPPPKKHFPRREESSGCLGWIFAIVVYMAISNWGGRIGLILGVILCVFSVMDGMPAGNIIFFLPMMIFFGFVIGAIINGIRKLVNKNK